MKNPIKWLIKLFSPKDKLKERIQEIIQIINEVKTVVRQPNGENFMVLLKDDKLLLILKWVLHKIGLSKSSASNGSIVLEAVRNLRKMDEIGQDQHFHQIATKMLIKDGAVVSEQAAGILVQNEYDALKALKTAKVPEIDMMK